MSGRSFAVRQGLMGRPGSGRALGVIAITPRAAIKAEMKIINMVLTYLNVECNFWT